jgi:D-3-phosphoglycerate dehydrogenase
MRVLVTCPPMLGMMDRFRGAFAEKGIEVHTPKVVQIVPESELIELVPQFDGWIVGDDPATRRVFEAGRAGRLRAAVKWGVGVDNVDFQAAADCGIRVENTPGMFGDEVADVAMAYVTGLARETYAIDRSVRAGGWPKPRGISLRGKRAGLVGYGDIGNSSAVRMRAAGMEVQVYDPALGADTEVDGMPLLAWPRGVGDCDFLVFTCALNDTNRHMLNAAAITDCKPGVRVVNVARGPLIDEAALIDGLQSGRIHSAALDVMEVEPLPADSPLRDCERCIFGSHNGSNTADAVRATTERAMGKLFSFLGV